MTDNKLVYISAIVILICLSNQGLQLTDGAPQFTIDYSNDTFIKDGKPFQYAAGSFHYSRVHPYYWQDRMKKMRAAGLNALQTYVLWNQHEIAPGKFKWDGSSDLERFLTLAKEEGLLVLLRTGPYICGEWEFGGFPAWLLTENPNMVLRTSDPSYMKWVNLWFQEMLPKVKPFLYKNGGPVVMVQIENEYGSYFACDKNYMLSLKDMVTTAFGNDVVLYTTDGDGDGFLRCGSLDGAYATVDFGISYNASQSFQAQRDYSPHGPLVNSEFYTGWLDHWGSGHAHTDGTSLAKSLDILLGYNSSNVNMYMFVGGTNFGFNNGANDPSYQPVPTSYDYDAPITEAGDITDKFIAVRDVVSKYLPLPKSPIPSNTTKMNLGNVPLTFLGTVQDALPHLVPNGPYKTKYPVNMEAIKFYGGFVLYRHRLTVNYTKPTVLYTRGTRDRAMVMVNSVPFGILDREWTMSVNVTGSANQYLDILVENQGRVGFSTDMNFNTKGLIDNVTLGGQVISDWLVYPLNMDNINQSLLALHEMTKTRPQQQSAKSYNNQLTTPSFYIGDINIPSSPQQLGDTFLDPRPFTKGQAFINDFNLGRYWPNRGPQVKLYVPKPVFLPQANHIYLFEVESSPCDQVTSPTSCQVSLVDTPYLDGPNGPELRGLRRDWKKDIHVSKETVWDSTMHEIH